MAIVQKISSNISGLRYAEEESPKVLPVNPVWFPMEPNSYGSFGGELTTIARNPINPGRQRKKGVVADFDASCDFTMDFTQTNAQDLLQGFMFADARRKYEAAPTAVDSATKQYTVPGTVGLLPGMRIFVTGFKSELNNGLKNVTAVAGDKITVAEDLVTDPVIPDDVNIVCVGMKAADGDISIEQIQGDFPIVKSQVMDFMALGLIPGEWIVFGNGNRPESFSNAENNGPKRIRSVTANEIVLDKSVRPMSTEDGAGRTVVIQIGRVFKNEVGDKVIRRTYQIERTLGASDPSRPTELQAEYLVGSVANTLELNVTQAAKLEATLGFIATDNDQRTSTEGIKPGVRPVTKESTAFNTSSDVKWTMLSQVLPGEAAPEPLFTFLTDLTLNIDNNVTPLKAVGVLGAFDTNEGTFAVSGSMTAYFATVEAVKLVRQNADASFHMLCLKEDAGFVIDMPLVTLGGAQSELSPDSPITLPMTMEAASGSKISPDLDYTLMIVFFDHVET